MQIDFILLIPCYNNLNGLISSIQSIYYPTNRFEILIIDDGSKTPIDVDYINNKFPDITIKTHRIQHNVGILNALNTGLNILHKRNDYKYIARLDCSDICHKDRFLKQVEFLDSNIEIGLLGTWCRFIDYKISKFYIYKTKTVHEDIKKEMHFKCSFIHPTVMFRSTILDKIGYYPDKFVHAEDYAYFCLILKETKGAILPEILVDIAVSSESISSKNYKKQLKSRMKIVSNLGENKLLAFWGFLFLLIKLSIPNYFIKKIKF